MEATQATLYLPGQPARIVTLAALTCEAAAEHLGVAPNLLDVLAGTIGLSSSLPDGYVAFALGDVDETTEYNEEATQAIEPLLGEWCEVYGPVVLVQLVTVPQPAPEPDMAATIADFLTEVRQECAASGAPTPSFVDNHRAGDTVLYS